MTRERADDVRLERIAQDLGIHGRRASALRVRQHAGIVHEHVQPPEPGLDPDRGRARLAAVAHVQSVKRHVETLGRKPCTGRLPLRNIARSQDHSHALARELADDLQSDAAIPAGDDGDPLDHSFTYRKSVSTPV